MKKSIYSFIATILITLNCFSNTPTLENDIDVKEKNQVENLSLLKKVESKKNESICTITCSDTYNGVTYTATAGNWFTSCRTAAINCRSKLMYMGLN
jgi:hypothetical protein